MLTPTSLPQTEFASEVFDSLKACVDTCPTTQGIKLRVAENGTILLPVAYDHESERFIVDEAWLNREQCIVELGLPPNVSQAMLALHVVKKLFKEAINQQANASSTENDLNTVNLDREVTRVEHKLHEYTAIKESLRFIPPIGIQLFISVSWRCADSFARKAVVQVHRESTCAHLKRHRLARDCKCHFNPFLTKPFLFNTPDANHSVW